MKGRDKSENNRSRRAFLITAAAAGAAASLPVSSSTTLTPNRASHPNYGPDTRRTLEVVAKYGGELGDITRIRQSGSDTEGSN